MKVGLIHFTEDYHKLVEMTARECYQSYGKLAPDSHKFVKGIMAKGHLSISSVGNMVFGVAGFSGVDEFTSIALDLMTMKEINNYIRWTMPDNKRNPDTKIGIIVSMNMLTFLDIYNQRDNYDFQTKLFDSMVRLISKYPELSWFIDKDVEVEPKDNIYTSKGEPELYEPVILTSDYTELKSKGLTDYELDIHATVTVNMKVDRSTGLQMWRHADMTGGTELSQRYVNLDNAEIRFPLGIEIGNHPKKLSVYAEERNLDFDFAKFEYDSLVIDFKNMLQDTVADYVRIRDELTKLGIHPSRAREVARAVLPNSITTKIIQCRPLRQWKHFFELRDSVHAQKEIQEDTKALKKAFREVGIEI